jgi:hypothetical protein
MKRSVRANKQGITLAEILVSLGAMALAMMLMTQAMIVLNKSAARSRVRNLARAMVLGRIQEAGVVSYDPTGTPPVVPPILAVGTTSEAVNLGDSSTGIGSLPATLQWIVASAGTNKTVSVRCRVDYTYLGRAQAYEASTFRAAD